MGKKDRDDEIDGDNVNKMSRGTKRRVEGDRKKKPTLLTLTTCRYI